MNDDYESYFPPVGPIGKYREPIKSSNKHLTREGSYSLIDHGGGSLWEL
jgi:hypothetical protein